MTMLLVASALSLLLVSTLASPAHPRTENLKMIIDQVKKVNDSLNKEFFVEDVQPLVDAGCKDTFFCKVNEILHKHHDHVGKLVTNLKTFTHLRNVNCTDLLKDVPSTGVLIQLPELMRHLTTCAQQRIFRVKKSNN